MTPRWWGRLAAGAMVVYGLLQLANFIWVGASLGFGPLLPTSDTQVYLQVAGAPWWSRQLWAGVLPFGYPVILKLLGTGLWLFILQSLAAAAAWLWLAWELRMTARRASVGAVSVIGVLVLSLTPELSTPHQIVMTESLSMSVMIVLVAMLLSWLRTGSRTVQAMVLPVSLVWIELRPTSVALVAVCAVVTAVWAVRSKRRDLMALAGGGLLLAASFVALGADQGGQTSLRWVVDTGLSDPEARTFLVDRGMPVNEAVLSLGEGTAIESDFKDRLAADPRLDTFRRWVAEDSSGAYVAWLLDDPGRLATSFGRSFSASFAEDSDSMFESGRRVGQVLTPTAREAKLPVGGVAGSAIWVRPHLVLGVIVAYTLMAATVLLRIRPRGWTDPRWKVGWLLVYLVPVHVGVSFFGDTVEQLRHGLGAALQLRLGVVLLLAWCFDWALAGGHRAASDGQRSTSASTRSRVTA